MGTVHPRPLRAQVQAVAVALRHPLQKRGVPGGRETLLSHQEEDRGLPTRSQEELPDLR